LKEGPLFTQINNYQRKGEIKQNKDYNFYHMAFADVPIKYKKSDSLKSKSLEK
jgi:hypothetical protein